MEYGVGIMMALQRDLVDRHAPTATIASRVLAFVASAFGRRRLAVRTIAWPRP